MRPIPVLSALPLAVAALVVASPQAAKAQDYDMDCKLLLCLPGGFPDGCGDAYDHMIDRLRDGKSPIGSCAMAGGGEYDDYEIDYEFLSARSPSGWECPEGTDLHHSSKLIDIEDGRDEYAVNVFCYRSSDTVRLGDTTRTYYTGMTRPERVDFMLDMAMNVSAEAPYETGPLRFATGFRRDSRTVIRYGE